MTVNRKHHENARVGQHDETATREQERHLQTMDQGFAPSVREAPRLRASYDPRAGPSESRRSEAGLALAWGLGLMLATFALILVGTFTSFPGSRIVVAVLFVLLLVGSAYFGGKMSRSAGRRDRVEGPPRRSA